MKNLDLGRFNYPSGFGGWREDLGDYVDIYYFRAKLTHLLLHDPSLVSSVYFYSEELFEEESSNRVDHLGLDRFFSKDFWQMEEGEMRSVMNSLISGNEAVMMRKLGLGIPRSMEFHSEEKVLVIRVDESLESHNFPRLDRPVCFFLAGLLAGMTSGRLGDYVAFEDKCIAEGDEYCEFFIGPRTPYVGRMRNYLDMPFSTATSSGVSKSMRGTWGAPDYTLLREHFVDTTLRALQFLAGEARPELGKQLHLFLLQQHNLGMLLGDSPEAPSTMREAGREAGSNLAMIGTASGIPAKEMIALMPEFLMRTGTGLVEFYRTGEGFEVRIAECAESTGLDLDQPVCHFETGLFAGFFQYLDRAKMEGEEVACSAQGHGSCIHRIHRRGEGFLDLTEILDEVERTGEGEAVLKQEEVAPG